MSAHLALRSGNPALSANTFTAIPPHLALSRNPPPLG
jgi:hypothetical protein